MDTFELSPGALVVDPFVGAGTTLVVARKRGVSAIGADLSPLAVLVSNAKIGPADELSLRASLTLVMEALDGPGTAGVYRPPRLQRAFTDPEFRALERLQQAVLGLPEADRRILLLALLRTVRKLSRAVPDGGWFRWRDVPSREGEILPYFLECVEEMLPDIEKRSETTGHWKAYRHDARELATLSEREPILSGGCDAIISSPPYPNRHDYSRIFQIELLMLGATESEVSELRRGSLRSHVEARSPFGASSVNSSPDRLVEVLDQLPRDGLDPRVRAMIAGYFEDIALVLASCVSVLKPGGYLALVVGNVRHGGVMIPVDEILVEIARSAGFTHLSSWVARLRGNSAQQMGKYGRAPARESVVMFRREH